MGHTRWPGGETVIHGSHDGYREVSDLRHCSFFTQGGSVTVKGGGRRFTAQEVPHGGNMTGQVVDMVGLREGLQEVSVMTWKTGAGSGGGADELGMIRGGLVVEAMW